MLSGDQGKIDQSSSVYSSKGLDLQKEKGSSLRRQFGSGVMLPEVSALSACFLHDAAAVQLWRSDVCSRCVLVLDKDGAWFHNGRMNTFGRRIYHNLGEFLTDLWMIASHRKEIRTLMQGRIISPGFRERLMLVVTQVNRCRYCSYAHAREALAKGVSQQEIEALGKGMFETSPSEEVPALLYAQHWAETDGDPETTVRDQVVARYGTHAVALIDLALRMIRAGNLSGNTFDYLLYRISFGQWGAGK